MSAPAVFELPSDFAPEARRILALLARPGAVLIASAELPRASIVRPSAGGLDVLGISSSVMAAALDGAGYVARLGALGGVARWSLSEAGRRYLDRAPRAPRAEPLKMAADRFPAGSEIRRILASGAADAVAGLLEELAGPEEIEALGAEWADLGVCLSEVELRLLLRLVQDAGRIVPSRALYRAYVSGRAASDELADPGLVRMALRRIREKLAAAGLPLELKTARGRGVAAIITAPDFLVPGQLELERAA